MAVVDACIDAKRKMISYRSFVIEEAYVPGHNVWQWTHENYDPVSYPVCGDCQTLFECIDAVEAWHEQTELAA